MRLAEKLQQVQQLENEISRMVDELKTQLVTAVAGQHLEGVKEIGCSGRVVSVSLSAITKTPGLNLSAEYYIPQSQADAINHRLAACKSSQQLCKAVREMIETGRVKQSGNSNYVYLNKETVRILRESELGQYVLGVAE